MIEQTIKPFDIKENLKLFESLCLIDGAVLVSPQGKLYAYGVLIKSNRVLKDFGTRHSAGLSASLKGATAFIVSEEERKIRVFRDGKMVMQIDSLEKGIERKSNDISNLLESIGVGALGFISAPFLGFAGITFIPGVIVFGGSYYLISKLMEKENGKR